MTMAHPDRGLLLRAGISAVLIGLVTYPALKAEDAKTSVGKETVSYSKQVSRIVQEKCQTCHHPGTAAPFSLLSYEDAVHWSGTIREVLTEKRMPPWHADPRYGHF